MSDADLEEIRKGRLAQLQQQSGGGAGGGTSQDDQKKQQDSEIRTSLLTQILTPEAADRLGRIRLVKESRATDVENRLIALAKGGQLKARVTEEQLKELLAAVAESVERGMGGGAGGATGGGGGGGSVVVRRRKGVWDEEGDDELLGL